MLLAFSPPVHLVSNRRDETVPEQSSAKEMFRMLLDMISFLNEYAMIPRP